MEPQLEDVVVELTAKPSFVGVFPLAVDDLEGDILVGRPRGELEEGKILIVLARYELVLRSLLLVDQIGVENVEFVALNDLRRWVIHVVMRLVVFVPLEAGVHPVEVSRLARSILVGPEVLLRLQFRLHAELRLVPANQIHLGKTKLV